MKLALTSVIVNNPLEAFKFYKETLGFLSKKYVPEAKLALVVSSEDPEGTGLLLEPNDNSIGSTFQQALYQQGLTAIVFGVEDIQQEYKKLKKLGVVFRKEPTKVEWGGIEAILDDTCGNWIQIFQA